MKLTPFVILLGLASQSLWAKAELNTKSSEYLLFCSGNRGKVNVVFEKRNDVMRFTYNNVDGKKDFPIFDGMVTRNTLPFIDMAKEELDIIDDKLVLEWKASECSTPTDNLMILACDGEAKTVYPENSKLTSFDVFTTKISEVAPTTTYEMFKVRFGLDSENIHYLIGMQFNPEECFVRGDSLGKRKK